jgi:hypothetical protein
MEGLADQNQNMNQSVTMTTDEGAGGGGGPSITFPFSPGDPLGNVTMQGSKNSLGRFLTKAGVDIEIASKVSSLSVQLFVNMDTEGINHFAGEEPGDRIILRSAHAALKADLARSVPLNSNKRSRELYSDEVEEVEEDDDGLEVLARMATANRSTREAELRRMVQQSRKQPASTVTVIYNDPYEVGATSEGKEHILSVYGNHSSDGTQYGLRMASLVCSEAPPKGTTLIKIPRLQLCLLSSNKADVIKRGEVISTVILTMDPSRWAALFDNDWNMNVEAFIEKAFELWSLPPPERNITDWDGIDKLKMVQRSAPMKSTEILTSLIKFKWSVTGLLCLAKFEDIKGESRATKSTPCTRENAMTVVVIKRLNNIMMALQSMRYSGVFDEFIHFISEEDVVLGMGGDQIVYNFDFAMTKVSSSVNAVTPMKLGDGTEYGTRGPREVAAAIRAAMRYQISLMSEKETMRSQKEEFGDLMARQLSRSQGGSGSADKATSREVVHDAETESSDFIKQPTWPEEKRSGKGKGAKRIIEKPDKKIQVKSNYLCLAYLGESLEVVVDGLRSKCVKGAECFYQHRKASIITKIEAEEALRKPADSDMKQAIAARVAVFKGFKK